MKTIEAVECRDCGNFLRKTSSPIIWFCDDCGEGVSIASFNPKAQHIVYGESEDFKG